jgi:hypothetical protein
LEIIRTPEKLFCKNSIELSVEALSATIISTDLGQLAITDGRNFRKNSRPFQFNITTAIFGN